MFFLLYNENLTKKLTRKVQGLDGDDVLSKSAEREPRATKGRRKQGKGEQIGQLEEKRQ